VRFTHTKRKGKVILPGYIFIKPKTVNTYQSICSTRVVIDFVRFEMPLANSSDETIDELKEVVDVMNDRMNQISLCQKGNEFFVRSGLFKDINTIFGIVNNILKRLQAEEELDIEPSLSGTFVSCWPSARPTK